MANDYTWLQSAVLNWLHRPTLAAQVPDFIMLAEKRISSDLTARLSMAATTLTTTAGVQTVNMPADVNNIISLAQKDYGELAQVTPERLANRYASGSTGVPRNYAVIGGKLRLGPTPDGAYALDFVYRAEIPPLATAVGGVNWLLTEHPEIYLAAAMCEALTYTRDVANLQVWGARYQGAIDALEKNDWNSGGTLSARVDSYTP